MDERRHSGALRRRVRGFPVRLLTACVSARCCGSERAPFTRVHSHDARETIWESAMVHPFAHIGRLRAIRIECTRTQAFLTNHVLCVQANRRGHRPVHQHRSDPLPPRGSRLQCRLVEPKTLYRRFYSSKRDERTRIRVAECCFAVFYCRVLC